jgi:hypothetical protein
MDKKEILRLAGDPRFISGIYNYCNRWCERCTFTSRCLNFATSSEFSLNVNGHDVSNEAFWRELSAIFEITLKMLHELADDQEIDLNDAKLDTAHEDFVVQRDKADKHELSQAARSYSELADAWLDSAYPIFKKKEDELQSLSLLGMESLDPEAEAIQITDAVEIIRWYQNQIYVKLMRALTHNRLEGVLDQNTSVQNDTNGSVKVALIGMDRSIGAWGIIHDHFQEAADSILEILLCLDRLRKRTEYLFPHARSFVRPGFDST